MSYNFKTIPHSPNAVHIIMVPHGDTFRKHDEIQGWIDEPADQLSSEGEYQAEEIGKKLLQKGNLNLDAIYTSPLGRCLKSAEKIAHFFPNAKIFKDERLKEICYGPYDTMTIQLRNDVSKQQYGKMAQEWTKTSTQTPDRFSKWKSNPLSTLEVPQKNANKAFDGKLETIYELFTRSSNSLKEIAKRHPGKEVLLTTHGPLIKTLADEAIYRSKKDASVLPAYFEAEPEKRYSKSFFNTVNYTVHHFVWDNNELIFWGTEVLPEKKN